MSTYHALDCVKFKDPAQHLFMWAVLFNRMDLAKMFWKLSDDHIGKITLYIDCHYIKLFVSERM